MEKAHAHRLARVLMNEHGLSHVPFAWNRRKSAIGLCRVWNGKPLAIELSEVWVSYMDEKDVRDTILHEVAHALTADEQKPHGYRWRAMARKIGANPARTAENVPMELQQRVQRETAKYAVVCPTHGTIAYLNRLGKTYTDGSRRCRQCGQRISVRHNSHQTHRHHR